MNRIEARFDDLRSKGKKAFMPYIAVGDPTLSATEELTLALDEAGVDVIELGIPFSDPIADGPSIQRASERALAAGASLEKGLRMAEKLRPSMQSCAVVMSYYNPIYRYGVESFCEAAAQAGVDGVIVPDLPLEESGELYEASLSRGIALIFLTAPTSSAERARRIAQRSRGFVYAVSLLGVTGARDVVSEDLAPLMDTLRGATDKPLCVGFGVGNAEQARAVAQIADGVIVGSAIANVIEAHIGKPNLVEAAQAFAVELTRAVKSV